MNPKAPPLLAGDTNVGMDLAQGDGGVLDALSTIRRRLPGCSLLIPPTVAEELAWLAAHADEAEERGAARAFLRQHRTWGFELIHTVPFGNAYVEQMAGRFLQGSLGASEKCESGVVEAIEFESEVTLVAQAGRGFWRPSF